MRVLRNKCSLNFILMKVCTPPPCVLSDHSLNPKFSVNGYFIIIFLYMKLQLHYKCIKIFYGDYSFSLFLADTLIYSWKLAVLKWMGCHFLLLQSIFCWRGDDVFRSQLGNVRRFQTGSISNRCTVCLKELLYNRN